MLTTGLLEVEPVGRVTTSVRVENLEDLLSVRAGRLASDQVRRVEIMEALVDTGATMFAMPRRYIEQLGLQKMRERSIITADGVKSTSIYDAVRLTIMGRDCTVEVREVPDVAPALVGQIPLEVLDLVVNPLAGTLTGNPEHGGEHVLELL